MQHLTFHAYFGQKQSVFNPFNPTSLSSIQFYMGKIKKLRCPSQVFVWVLSGTVLGWRGYFGQPLSHPLRPDRTLTLVPCVVTASRGRSPGQSFFTHFTQASVITRIRLNQRLGAESLG